MAKQVKDERLGRKDYEKKLERLQADLCRLQDWVKEEGERIIVVFEGRDAAGKGGLIRRMTERVSPRIFRVVALPAPSDREKSQIYIQRYMQHFPAAGEIVIFDRSWYNRAGVEHVMGFCTKEQHRRFLDLCPTFEKYMVEGGLRLIKYWLEVSNEEQKRRFEARIEDPLRQWKLSPMDLPSRAKWYAYSKARDAMLKATDTEWAPWYIVPSDDKQRARLNCISHFLSLIPYKKVKRPAVELPKRSKAGAYDDVASLKGRNVISDVKEATKPKGREERTPKGPSMKSSDGATKRRRGQVKPSAPARGRATRRTSRSSRAPSFDQSADVASTPSQPQPAPRA